mgnify:CR=1 FL=1
MAGMRILKISLTVAIQLNACVLTAGATDGENARAEAWVQQQLVPPAAFSDIPVGFKIEYEITTATTSKEQDVLRLRQEIAGKPNHPRRLELERLERLIQSPVSQHFTIWYETATHWRLNRTEKLNGELIYSDNAENESGAWRQTPSQLSLFGSAENGRPANRDPRNILKAESFGMALFWGIVSEYQIPGASLTSISKSENGWNATISAPGSKRWELRFRWFDDLGTFFPLSLTRFGPDGKQVPYRWTFEPPIRGPEGRPTCRRVTFDHTSLSVLRTISLIEWVKLSHDDIRKVTRTPDRLGDDVIRGTLSAQTILDARQDEVVLRSFNSDGQERVQVLEGSTGQSRGTLIFKIAIVICGCLGGVIIVFCRLLRRS